MPTFEDWLNDPISIINNIFCSDKHNFDSKVQEYFKDKLSIEKNYYSIPSLNEVPLHEIKPNSLVRYRCMVQDVFNPVYYTNVQRIRHKVSGEVAYMSLKYRESIDVPDGYEIDGDVLQEHLDELKIGNGCATGAATDKSDNESEQFKTNLEQRVTFYCVPIPGENKWVKHSYKVGLNGNGALSNASNSAANNQNRSSKRLNEFEKTSRTMDGENAEEEEVEANECEEKENQMESSTSESYAPVICQEKDTNTTTTLCKICYKYKVHETKPDEKEENEVIKTVNVTKKTKVEDEKTTVSTEQNGKKWTNWDMNFPLGGEHESGHACLVKIYDNYDEFKLNDMVEFVGILSQDPSLAYEHDEHTCFMENNHGLPMSADWQPEAHEERRDEQTKTETYKLESATNAAANAIENDHSYCKCSGELVDVSVTRHIQHTHSHKKVVLSAYPPSLVPRLHCVLSHKLSHNNPLLDRPWRLSKSSNEKGAAVVEASNNNDYWSKQLDVFVATLKSSNSQMGSVDDPLNLLRKEIIDVLQELLLGDSLAAEFLLMHLISSVFNRKDVTILGKFALNITNVPTVENTNEKDDDKETNKTKPNEPVDNFAQSFFDVIKHFVPTSHLFSLTTDNLNNANLIPNKDYNKDKLLTGMLQLPYGFQLCIDETVLNAGQLNQKGLINLTSIGEIIKWQKLNYDFSYHQQEFSTDIRMLILSQTKSILPFDFQLKLNADTANFDLNVYKKIVANILQRTSFLNNVRKYLTIISHMDYRLTEKLQKIVENDIVTMRKDETSTQQNKGKMSVDDFHQILVIARLQSLSYAKTELGINEWSRAKSLYCEKMKRQN